MSISPAVDEHEKPLQYFLHSPKRNFGSCCNLALRLFFQRSGAQFGPLSNKDNYGVEQHTDAVQQIVQAEL